MYCNLNQGSVNFDCTLENLPISYLVPWEEAGRLVLLFVLLVFSLVDRSTGAPKPQLMLFVPVFSLVNRFTGAPKPQLLLFVPVFSLVNRSTGALNHNYSC